jgi:Methyltransferase domain
VLVVSWLVKALAQRAIGALPNPHYWNELLQERITHSVDLTRERFEDSLRNCKNHLEQFEGAGGAAASGAGFSAFELGTGWFPVVALGFFLRGAREVWTWDVAPLLTLDRLKRTAGHFLDLAERPGSAGGFLARPERVARLREAMALCDRPNGLGPAEILERLDIRYRVGDASKSNLPPQSVDLIVSDVVLEYLSSRELSELLQEFRRIATPTAVLSHTIGLADQYAARDPSITPFNFLRFSDRTWRWLNNPIIPLNRLRISDYRQAFGENGFRLLNEFSRRGDAADLARTELAPRFRAYSMEDLLVVYTWIVATPRSG